MAWATMSIEAVSSWFSSHWRVTGVFRHDIPYSFSASQDISQQLAALNGLLTRAYFLLGLASQVKEDFPLRNLSSSNPEVATIDEQNFDGAQFDASKVEFHFTVAQLAGGQVNLGRPLAAAVPAAVNPGSNAFTLEVGGTGHNFMVIISAGDSNDSALSKMAQAINAADTGVTATVVRWGDYVRLCLQGREGAGQAFTLADTAGNAVTATAADTVTQVAREARFLINGVPYIQDTNTVSLLADRLRVVLKDAGEAVISLTQNDSLKLVESLVQAVNHFSSYVENQIYLEPALTRNWGHLVDHYAVVLSPYGLEAASDGQLKLNTRTLKQALETQPEAVIAAVSGEDGWATEISAFMAHLLTAPGAALLAPADTTAGLYLPPDRLSPWFQVAPAGFSQVV